MTTPATVTTTRCRSRWQRTYLAENKGRQFDPACVDAFLSRWDEVIEIAGQRARPFQTTEAPLVCTAASAAEKRTVEPRPVPVS